MNELAQIAIEALRPLVGYRMLDPHRRQLGIQSAFTACAQSMKQFFRVLRPELLDRFNLKIDEASL